MGVVNQWKWVNQFQPQTLYMATILCYIDAVFGLLFGVVATSFLAGLITIIALGRRRLRHRQREEVGLRGRRRRRGAAGRACCSRCSAPTCSRRPLIISLLFDGALVALLLHPMSREYQRIWFK